MEQLSADNLRGFAFSIPDHDLLECIGSGSYGQVWRARNIMGSYRAVKTVWRDAFKDAEPFEREMRGIRKFEPISRSHIGFVNILHVGQDAAQGCFYYVMELGDDLEKGAKIPTENYRVKTLERVLRSAGPMSVDAVVGLGLRLSDALHHLHESGLVHRDIKPANIIFVGDLPKLADIGLVTDPKEADTLVGTTGFIPPEGPGTRKADIHALGKVLYECLTGLDRSRFPEIPEFIEKHPEAQRFLEVNEILIKACHPDARQRYESARKMHAELAAVENGASIVRLRHLERTWGRWKRLTPVAIAGMLAAALSWFAIDREMNRSEQERQRSLGWVLATSGRAVETGDYAEALRNTAKALPLLHEPRDQEINRLRFETILGQMPKLTLVLSLGAAVNWCEFSPDGKRVLVAMGDGRTQVRDAGSGELIIEFSKHRGAVTSASFSSDGARAVTGGLDGKARVWDVPSGQQLALLTHSNSVQCTHFHPTGDVIATGSGDGWVRIWDWRTGKLRQQLGRHSKRVESIRFNRNGDQLVSSGADHKMQVWNLATGKPFGEPFRHSLPVYQTAFSPDAHLLASACGDGSSYVWSVDTHSLVAPPMSHERSVRYVEFSVDGRYLLTAGWDGVVSVWNAGNGTRLNPLLRHGAPVMCAGFSSDGRRVLTGCTDGTVRIWDWAGRAFPERLPRERAALNGQYLVLTNHQAVQVYALGRRDSPVSRLAQPVRQLLLVGEPASLVTVAGVPGIDPSAPTPFQLQVWDALTGKPRTPALPLNALVSKVTLSGAGNWLVLSSSNIVMVANLSLGNWQGDPIVLTTRVKDLALSADGKRLAVASARDVHVLDTLSGKRVAPPLHHEANVSKVSYSQTEPLFVTCSSDAGMHSCYAQVWNSQTGKPVGHRLWHRDGIKDVAWLEGAKKLVTVGEDGLGRIWAVAEGPRMTSEFKHHHQIMDVAIAEPQKLLLTASWDKTVRLWDWVSGQAVSPPLPFSYELEAAHFGPSATSIVAVEVGGVPWLLRTPTNGWPETLLADLAALLCGAVRTAGPENEFRSAESLAGKWQQLKRIMPDCFSVTIRDVVAWHEWESEHCSVAKNTGAELLHLEYMLNLDPENSFALKRKAILEQELGRTAR